MTLLKPSYLAKLRKRLAHKEQQPQKKDQQKAS